MFLLNFSTRFQLISMDFAIDLAIFTKALPTDQPTDGPTDRRTDRRTDIPSYRDAIAASKNHRFLHVRAHIFHVHPSICL